MPSPIEAVALCSPTGKFGPHLLKALQAEGFTVTVILRESSKATFLTDQKIIRVSDDFNEDELVAAFKGLDAVVLSLNFELLPQATKFAQASIAAGNRWLIASTYGPNLDDPRYDLFPPNVPHRHAVDDLQELQKGQAGWAWTSITCGPWPELAVAANAWHIDPAKRTAELLDGGRNVFSCSTREQASLAVARILKLQPASMRNNTAYVASFEVDMSTWLDAHKQILGSDGWTVRSVDSETMVKQAQEHFAGGDFLQGYVASALPVCTGPGFRNRFSDFATLANDELGLPKEDLVEVVGEGLELPNPFA